MQISVVSLRRYPVKSMGGEGLDRAELDQRGIVGDRWFAVEDDEGRFASGKNTRRFRRRDRVFDYDAGTDARGRVSVRRAHESWHVGDPRLDQQLSSDMGAAVRVTAEADVPHQDMGPVSLVSTGTMRWCSQRWGGRPDARRLRANVVVEADEPFVEEGWVEREIELGSARLRIVARAPRCRMVDISQDGTQPAHAWLKHLAEEREMSLAVYAEVTHPGHVAIGDVLRVV